MDYWFQNKKYSDIFSLAKDLSVSQTCFEEVKSERFLSFVEEKDAVKAKRVRALLLQSVPEDVMIFRIGEILNPFMSFSFHQKKYESFEQLGKAMLSFSPNPDPVLLSIIRYELISEYMRVTLFDVKNKKEYDEVAKIEKESRQDLIYSYYCMGYFLSKSTSIIYDGVLYKDIYNLTYYLAKKEKDLDVLGSYFSFSPLLRAYMRYSDEKQKIDSYLHLCHSLEKSEHELSLFLEKRKK